MTHRISVWVINGVSRHTVFNPHLTDLREESQSALILVSKPTRLKTKPWIPGEDSSVLTTVLTQGIPSFWLQEEATTDSRSTTGVEDLLLESPIKEEGEIHKWVDN